MSKKLSLLIPTLEDRAEYLGRLLKVLQNQLTEEVEVIIEKDNREKTIGEKRNLLLSKSSGEYIAFIDDDDLVSSDYVSKVLAGCKENPDVIGMHLLHYNDSKLAGFTYHSLRYNSWWESRDLTTGFMRYYRNPNHLNPVKREHALKCPFPHINNGEDKHYSAALLQYLKTEHYILEPVYFYLFRYSK